MLETLAAMPHVGGMDIRGLYRRRKPLIKFLILVGILIAYFFYLSVKYDATTGGIVSALTWSFFVLCTPIADGGFLIDFPLRLLFDVRMVVSEIFVWALAISTNVATLSFAPERYETTALTRLYRTILETPYPYWGIIVLSGIGTFLSLLFGDELIHHVTQGRTALRHFGKAELRWLAMLAVYGLIVVGYYQLLSALGIRLEDV